MKVKGTARRLPCVARDFHPGSASGHWYNHLNTSDKLKYSSSVRHPGPQFHRDGFVVVADVLTAADCETLASHVCLSRRHSAGARNLLTLPWCRALADTLARHVMLAKVIPQTHVAVQCTYFEKSVDRNWLVPWHRDESIPVASRVDHAALQGWSVKEGQLHVIAPPELLRQLVAVRIHLDDCLADDGPLRVAPGSHRHEEGAPASDPVACVARRGDVLALTPMLLHASSKATGSSARRVLHFVYGPPSLPMGLQWPHRSEAATVME